VRWRQPALRGDATRVFHVHNDNRIIEFHRWLEGAGRDVIVVASLNENTFHNYSIGFPGTDDRRHWAANGRLHPPASAGVPFLCCSRRSRSIGVKRAHRRRRPG
jgi:hypothetical protein